MRRLATQSRDDTYRSTKDYQTLHEAIAQRFSPKRSGTQALVLRASLDATEATSLVAFGGYVRPSEAVSLNGELLVDDELRQSRSFGLDARWSRIGLIVEATNANAVTVKLKWEGTCSLEAWGWVADSVALPPRVSESALNVEELNQTHLLPETFYLPHDNALRLDIDADASTMFAIDEGTSIYLKKCSYCGRLLPVDPERLGALALHKHMAKRTNHQNECRACKKWRINDAFNPKRTVDQLNESSLITRERQLFLREPAILQEIKDRTGAGLKSQVWERFGRRCFNCERPLQLDEVDLDHTRPLAYLWPIDEHATSLCGDCNGLKREKFPVDFYTDRQLRRLAKTCGLAYRELRMREINQAELDRVVTDIRRFALEWDPRTFSATARKVKELRADIDLFEVLLAAAPGAHAELKQRLKERPPSIGAED